MATSNNVCYYGQHIGCPYTNDPNCRRCAERLTYAVNYVALNANSVSRDVSACVGNQSYGRAFER